MKRKAVSIKRNKTGPKPIIRENELDVILNDLEKGDRPAYDGRANCSSYKKSYRRNMVVTNSANQNPPPISSRTHIFFSNFALKRESIMRDCYELLLDFSEKKPFDFKSFKSIWFSKKFSYIHFSCPERIHRESFITTLYQTFLSFLYENTVYRFPNYKEVVGPLKEHIEPKEEKFGPVALKLGIVFALYLVYSTNPSCFPTAYIQVDPKQWEVILGLYKFFYDENQKGVHRHNKDEGVYALGKLIEKKAFVLSAYIDHVPYYYQYHNFLKDESNKFLKEEDASPVDASKSQTVESDYIDKKLTAIEKDVYSRPLGGIENFGITEDIKQTEQAYELNKAFGGFINSETDFALDQAKSKDGDIIDYRDWLADKKNDMDKCNVVGYLNHLTTVYESYKAKFIPENLFSEPDLRTSTSSTEDSAPVTTPITAFDTLPGPPGASSNTSSP
ncbi:hypothetical protein K502DRAFT_352175 [Neoconidiobolus thromboides FSU 785]|nr:hypothetical protein K502DRAFT_352175 [Neoconidiobolus thromboides FSU 785]